MTDTVLISEPMLDATIHHDDSITSTVAFDVLRSSNARYRVAVEKILPPADTQQRISYEDVLPPPEAATILDAVYAFICRKFDLEKVGESEVVGSVTVDESEPNTTDGEESPR